GQHAVADIRLIVNYQNQRVGYITINHDLTVRLARHELLTPPARHADRKHRPFTRLRSQLQPVIEQLHEAFHDRQSQAQPFPSIALGILQLTKLLKNFPMLVFWDTPPGVADLDPHRVGGAPRAQYDAPSIGVADRIRHQVAHDSLE